MGVFALSINAQAGSYLKFKNAQIATEHSSANKTMFKAAFQSASSKNSKYQVVQFKDAITMDDQAWLKGMGLEVLRYVPEDAYIVRANNLEAVSVVESDPRIQAVVAFAPELRINSKAMMASVFNQNKTKLLHVRAFDGEDYSQVQKSLESIRDLEILNQENGAYIVKTEMANVSQISEIDGIEWVDYYHAPKSQVLEADQNFIEETNGNLAEMTGYESGTKLMNFDAAWKRGLNGKGQTITVADTGLDTGDETTLNKDFAGLSGTLIGGYFSKTWGDPNGHGTHVSGSAVGRGASSNGKVLGGAYGASLVIESLWSKEMDNLTVGPDPTPLFKVVYEKGQSRIHTNSWGSPEGLGEYDDSARAVDQFVWDNPDFVILFAAGNQGEDQDGDGRIDSGTISSPGTSKNAITVGASENLVTVGGYQMKLGQAGGSGQPKPWGAEPLASDRFSNNPKGLAAFSSRGPTLDQRRKPDLVAPGTNILSSCSKYEGASKMWGSFNNELCFCGGTSMSTPLVAGAAAVVRQYLIQVKKMGKPSASLVKAVLMHTSTDLFPGQFGLVGKKKGQELLEPGPNNDQGYGLVNMDAATDKELGLIDESAGVSTGEAKTYELPAGTRKVTLVYSDAPGSTSAEKALVNDLDISVKIGAKVVENVSRLDNNEQIVLPESNGKLSLVVKGFKVPVGRSGRQPFSVVYSR